MTQPFCYTRNFVKFPRLYRNEGIHKKGRRQPFVIHSDDQSENSPLIMVQIMQYAVYGRSEGVKHVVQCTRGSQESKDKTNRSEKRPLDDSGSPTVKHNAPPQARWGPWGEVAAILALRRRGVQRFTLCKNSFCVNSRI